jgi:hypothetical protein
MLFGQLPRLPFAQGKQRRLRQREKETCARENQNRRYRHLHVRSLKQIACRKKQKEATRIARINANLIRGLCKTDVAAFGRKPHCKFSGIAALCRDAATVNRVFYKGFIRDNSRNSRNSRQKNTLCDLFYLSKTAVAAA